MTDSENSQPQDDSDEDIYKDIPEFNFEDELAKLEGSKETYKQEVSDLSEKVKALTEENKELKKSNEVLKKNLSTLLKTAQAEVQRKDSMIEELRSKVDCFTFRRSKKSVSDKLTSTDDLNYGFEVKQGCEKQKSDSEKKRSKSYENRTSSDSEHRSKQEEKKSGSQPVREENLNCDNDKKSGCYRENAQNSNFRHSDGGRHARNERHKERKSGKYEDSSGHRRPFRESHRDHLLYDTFDRKRHSRSSDNRFLSRRRSSRERGRDHRRSDSCERWKKSHRREESSERSRRRESRKNRSRSRGSKESSLEKPKSRSSMDSDLVNVRTRTEMSKGGADGTESRKRMENCEKKRSEGEGAIGCERSKQKKEKGPNKSEKRRSLEIFETKSPLDALYNDMVASRSCNRVPNSKPGTTRSESDLEEGELLIAGSDFQGVNQEKEDWTLSFKNERPNETKPMTLYSRRMMQKFSSETKERERGSKRKEEKDEKVKKEEPGDRKSAEKVNEKPGERKSAEKINEKEPGELTDDENVIESSKEFQELTKVAAIESEMIEKPEAECFKEPKRKESVPDVDSAKVELKDNKMDSEQVTAPKEDPITCKDFESSKAMCDVIEFSPFKNNYKLIEISPIKPPENKHILDFYNKKAPATNRSEGSVLESSEKAPGEKGGTGKPSDTSGEKDSWKNSSSENNSETELKIVAPSLRECSKESEKMVETNEKESKNENKEFVKRREKKSKTCKQESNSSRGKRKSSSTKEMEKVVADEKNRKRKRRLSEMKEEKPEPKKPKLEKSEPPRKSRRTKRNSKDGVEGNQVQETEAKSVQGKEIKTKEDISSFEFFKPLAAAELPEAPGDVSKAVCTATDFKMTATMSVTEVVRLETPSKCLGKLKNLMINEEMIFSLDAKNHSQFSPLIGSKSIEMTPRGMLKNDLMLSDSEDDSIDKQDSGGEDIEELDEEEGDLSGSEYSDCDSDSGASDFVDLL